MAIAARNDSDMDALFGRVSSLPVPAQEALIQQISVLPNQDASTVRAHVENYLSTLPIGNDIMAASPTTLGVANELGEVQRDQKNGRTSIDKHDIDLMSSRVEALVKQMIAEGKSDKDILTAIGRLPINPELADLAQQQAQQQIQANENPFIDRNSNVAQEQGQSSGFGLASIIAPLATAAVISEEARAAEAAPQKQLDPIAALLAREGFVKPQSMEGLNQSAPQNPLSVAALLPNQPQRENDGWIMGA